MKKKKKPQKITRGSVIALSIFAAPFLLWGIYSAARFFGTLADHSEMQSWVEAPATIETAELVADHQSRGRGRTKGSSRTMYKVIASYEYDFEGQNYRGDRVSLYTGSDGNVKHHHPIYHELKRHIDERSPFRCFVNPEDPQQSVLYRDWRWNVSGIYAAHAALFGGLGLFLIGSSLYCWRKQQHDVDYGGAAGLPAGVRSVAGGLDYWDEESKQNRDG